MKTNHLELNLHSPLRSACFNEKTQESNLQLASELNGEAARRVSRWHMVNLACLVFVAILGWTSTARSQSALDGFDPGANNMVNALAVQPDGKILVGGGFTTLGGGGAGTTPRNNIGRLNPDGSLDNSFDPGANGTVYTLAVQPDGKILVGGYFTTLGGGGTGTATRNRIGRLNPDGSLDTSFDPGANNTVWALTVQPDGKILVGGYFTTLGGGGTGTATRNRIGRLNPDGSLDTSFDPGANSAVETLAAQPDGKVLVGGGFTTLGGGGTGTATRNRIGRLNPNGSLDTSFNPGANYWVHALAVQPDGMILVAGEFTMLGGGGTGTTMRNRIGRLNPDGSLDTSFNPGASSWVYALEVQADGKILVGGGFTGLGGGTGTTPCNFIGRLNPDGTLDTSFIPGANSYVYALALQLDAKIMVGGEFTKLGGGGWGTTTRNYIGRVHADGSLDTALDPGADGYVRALAVQPDGKILVGGQFQTLGGGGTGTTTRNCIGRLNPDGSVDTSFNPGTNWYVYALAVQPDGKILVGGDFMLLGGGGFGTTPRNHIGRLNPDGSLDTSFNPGANGPVLAMAVQPDGKILVGGFFTRLGGGGTGTTDRYYIGRLNPDGSLDTSFDLAANWTVETLILQPDGKILVGGGFTLLGGGGSGTTTRNSIARLNPDGSLDTSFDPGANGLGVATLALQADGKILVGGYFTTLGGGGTGTTSRNMIGRLYADGSLDTSFNPGANYWVHALALQADGKILVGGYFTTLGGGGTGTTTRHQIGRLNADGSLDTSFDPGANGYLQALAVQPDGKILVGGWFTTLGGGGTGTTTRNSIGRLMNNEAALENLGVDGSGSVITWSRSGAGPEVERVTFESSPDGINYDSLGVGTRIAGGWQLSGVSLPKYQNVFLRARGFFSTGQYNGSGSIVESVREVYLTLPPTPPTVTTNLATNVTSSSASLNGTVNPNGSDTSVVFEWGTTKTYGNTTAVQSIGNGTSNVAATADLTGLTPDTLYHYRVTGTNSGGTTLGNDVPFVASLCSAASVNPTSQSFSALGGNGSVYVTAACNWTAVPSDPWIIITFGGTGSGNGTINYTVGSHSNPTSRSSTITIGATSLAVFQGAQFADVPTSHGFYEQIGRLSARGITSGCGGGNYCPEASVTREQMAIFIERSLGVSTPPIPVQQTFEDVLTTWFSYPFIEDFSARGITAGCSMTPRLYCPASSVTREQMAIFIERALGVVTPPTPTQQTFEDVPTNWFSYPFIEDFATRGITAGCSITPRLYCPASLVTRGQMAVFLVRAFGL